MKPYGIKFVGPCCAWGCCWMQTVPSGFNRRLGHGVQPYKKRARQAGKREVRAELREATPETVRRPAGTHSPKVFMPPPGVWWS